MKTFLNEIFIGKLITDGTYVSLILDVDRNDKTLLLFGTHWQEWFYDILNEDLFEEGEEYRLTTEEEDIKSFTKDLVALDWEEERYDYLNAHCKEKQVGGLYYYIQYLKHITNVIGSESEYLCRMKRLSELLDYVHSIGACNIHKVICNSDGKISLKICYKEFRDYLQHLGVESAPKDDVIFLCDKKSFLHDQDFNDILALVKYYINDPVHIKNSFLRTKEKLGIKNNYRKLAVRQDGQERQYSAFLNPTIRRWNGWLSPAFTYEDAQDILSYEPVKYCYCNSTDSFIVTVGDNQMIYKGFDIIFDGSIKHVYSIGQFDWPWEEIKTV